MIIINREKNNVDSKRNNVDNKRNKKKMSFAAAVNRPSCSTNFSVWGLYWSLSFKVLYWNSCKKKNQKAVFHETYRGKERRDSSTNFITQLTPGSQYRFQ